MYDYKNEIIIQAYKEIYALFAMEAERAIALLEKGNAGEALCILLGAQSRAEDIYIHAAELADTKTP